MADYLIRVLDGVLDEIAPDLPALALEGPKAVGKSETLSRRARSIIDLDDAPTLELLINDADLIDRLEAPVLIDEWQRHPAVWDRVRRSVDRRPQPGRFLLAGSATPRDAQVHSGAGRIVRLRMRPLSWAERGRNAATVSLNALLTGSAGEISGESPIRLADYVEEIVASGFPAIRAMGARSRRLELDSYISQIVEREFAELGVRVRRPDTLRGWLRGYAAAVGSTASYTAILDASTPGETVKPAKTTTMVYRDLLSQLWLLDPVPAWTPTDNPFTRLAAAPKHYLADPALALRLLDLREEDLLRGSATPTLGPQSGGLLGRLFEALVALSLQTYVVPSEASLGHLRTRNGDHEIDFIVSRGTKIIGIEVKLAPTVSDQDVRHLHWLRDAIGERFADGVVITTGSHAYRRVDGIAVVPAALLGP